MATNISSFEMVSPSPIPMPNVDNIFTSWDDLLSDCPEETLQIYDTTCQVTLCLTNISDNTALVYGFWHQLARSNCGGNV
jgi:hypothetical protein